MAKYVYVVCIYCSFVKKDGTIIEDHDPVGCYLETEDYKEALEFYNSHNLYDHVRDWLQDWRGNKFVKFSKTLNRWIEYSHFCQDYESTLEANETSWMKLDREKFLDSDWIVPMTDKEIEDAGL